MKLICIGQNYADHISELGNKRTENPVVFLKPDSSILPKNNPFYIPEFSNDLHYEVELLVKINRIGKYIEKQFAHKYYNEIGLGIDFTARDLQQELRAQGLPWEKAKAFDGSAVIGSFLPKSQFDDLQNISFSLSKNEETVQKGNSSLMIWSIDDIIAYVSQFFTLKIGDIIFTGTPSGVGSVAINDKLTGYIDNQAVLSVNVK